MSKIFAKHMEAIKEAETFIANNIGLDTVSLLVEYGKLKRSNGRQSGYRSVEHRLASEREDPIKFEKTYLIDLGGYVKHHNEVGIAIEETLHGWKVMLPSGLYTEVNEKDLTAISSAEFVEAVKPSRFVTQFEK